MYIYAESINGIFHGTEPLEQNYVPLYTGAEGSDGLGVLCNKNNKNKKDGVTLL